MRTLLATSLLVASTIAVAANIPIQKIHFHSGSNKLVLVGKLNHAIPVRIYSFVGKRGQHLKIKLVDLGKLVTMYHITFPKGSTFGMKGYDPFNGKLTENGTYKIEVDVNQMATLADSGKYRLTLTRS